MSCDKILHDSSLNCFVNLVQVILRPLRHFESGIGPGDEDDGKRNDCVTSGWWKETIVWQAFLGKERQRDKPCWEREDCMSSPNYVCVPSTCDKFFFFLRKLRVTGFFDKLCPF